MRRMRRGESEEEKRERDEQEGGRDEQEGGRDGGTVVKEEE